MKKHDSIDTAARLIESWGRLHDVMVSCLIEALGRDKIMEILCARLRRLGTEEVRDQTARDAVAIARVLMDFETCFGMEPVLERAEADHVVRTIPTCPWSYFRPESCDVLAAWVQGICEGLNPNYEYVLTRAIPRGDDCCAWEIRRRPEESGTS